MYDIRIYKEADEYKKIVVISIGIIVLFSWFIYEEFRFMTIDYRDSDLFVNMGSIFVAGIIITFLFIFLIKLANKILSNDPFLVFEDDEIVSKGLVGNSSIKWENIKSYNEVIFMGMPSIVLELKEKCEYKDNISYIRTLVFKYNKYRVGGEIIFTASFLDDKYLDVVSLIKEKVVR